jgi:hypothetical protein
MSEVQKRRTRLKLKRSFPIRKRSKKEVRVEIFRINIKPQSEIERHEAFKKSLHNCPLCESNLEFELEGTATPHQLLEKARCPSCDVDIRTEVHIEQ